MPINKVFLSFQEAVADVHDGATIMFGGFVGKPGSPTNLIIALRDKGAKNLTVVSNRCGGMDLDILFEARQVRKAIASAPVTVSSAPIATETLATTTSSSARRLMPSPLGCGSCSCPDFAVFQR